MTTTGTRLEPLLADVLDALPSGLMVLNKQHQVILINQRARTLFEIAPEKNLSGIPDFPEYLTPLLEVVRESQEDQSRQEVQLTLPNRLDNPVTFGFSLKHLAPEGQQGLVVLMFNDITSILRDRRALDKIREELSQSRKMASVGTLIAGVVHELNNPLTGISMSTELSRMGLERLKQTIQQGNADPELLIKMVDLCATEVNKSFQSVKKASVLVSDLLTYSKPTLLTMSPASLYTLLEECVNATKSHPDFAQVHLKFQMQGGDGNLFKDLNILCDRVKLEQVFYNLFKNAGEAMKGKGSITVTMSETRPEGKQKRFFQVDVQDTGSGMDPSVIERIFEPFFTTKKDAGTGLGLSMSYRTIEQHGGEIQVTSNPGQGTTFTILVPILEEGDLAG